MSKQLARSARKRFGQNFLIDGRVVDAILASITASASDTIVEIGPGHGAITEGLYAFSMQSHLIELDRDLVPGLLASFVSQSPERCRLLNEDVLKVDFTQLGNALRIVGNLPYNISTPLLFKLLERGESDSRYSRDAAKGSRQSNRSCAWRISLWSVRRHDTGNRTR